MSDPGGDDRIDDDVFCAWADALTPVAAPSSIKDRLLARVRSAEPVTLLRTVRAAEGWTDYLPGIQIKMLYRDEAAVSKSFLVRLAAGVSLPAHEHDTTEECLVLEGEITLGDVTVRAGDYHLAAKAAHHGVVSTRTGALLFLRTGLHEHVAEI